MQAHHCSTFRSNAGFTLIELLVVTVIIGIILAMAVVNLVPDETEDIKQEAQRLALLIQSAQEHAILQGNIVVLGLARNGYTFYQPDAKTGKLEELTGDDVLRRRQLAKGVEILEINIDGVILTKNPMIVLYSTGELIPFTITFGRDRYVWFVEGAATGAIRAGAEQEASAT